MFALFSRFRLQKPHIFTKSGSYISAGYVFKPASYANSTVPENIFRVLLVLYLVPEKNDHQFEVQVHGTFVPELKIELKYNLPYRMSWGIGGGLEGNRGGLEGDSIRIR